MRPPGACRPVLCKTREGWCISFLQAVSAHTRAAEPRSNKLNRIADPEGRAKAIFDDDLAKTYGMMMERAQNALYEEEHGRERIQLVAEDPSHSITFNVPDGPPPEKLVLEGPGTEELDIEEVRKALQLRWNIFSEFEPELQAALKDGSLDKVNDALGNMEVARAESVVKLLEVAGILSFSREGIVDETEQAKTADAPEPETS